MKNKRYTRLANIFIVIGIVLFILTACGESESAISATESISEDDIKGVYVSSGLNYGIDAPYSVTEISEDAVRVYESKSDYLNGLDSGDGWSTKEYNYTLEQEDGVTILTDHYSDGGSYPGSLTYFEDLNLLWIGGMESHFLFKTDDSEDISGNEYLDYNIDFVKSFYYEDSVFGEEEWSIDDDSWRNAAYSYFKGTWTDQRDNNNSFVFMAEDSSYEAIVECSFPDISKDSFVISKTIDSDAQEQWEMTYNNIGIQFDQIVNRTAEDDGSYSSGYGHRIIIAPIADNICAVYYQDLVSAGGSIEYGHGTLFKKQ